jgi:hypothetical protein
MTRSTVDDRPRLSEPRNHFEEIKAMSMEELAVWLASIGPVPEVMLKFWREWLKEEITDA